MTPVGGQALLATLRDQRNAALDEVANSAASLAELQARIGDLEGQITTMADELVEARKPASPLVVPTDADLLAAGARPGKITYFDAPAKPVDDAR